jgi:hypothetical protein
MQQNSTTQAQQIATRYDDDGQVWRRKDGRRRLYDDLNSACAVWYIHRFHGSDAVRWELPDGSAIVTTSGGWDLGIPSTDDDDRGECTCFASCCALDLCADGCSCECHRDEDARLTS